MGRNGVISMLDPTQLVHPPLRRWLTGLVFAGAGIAVMATILASLHGEVRDALVYIAVAVGSCLVAVGVARSVRWVVALTLLGCAGQIGAVVGTVLELVDGVAPFKAAQLRRLGFAPDIGVGINLVYSTVAFGLFCWFASRWLRRRRRG